MATIEAVDASQLELEIVNKNNADIFDKELFLMEVRKYPSVWGKKVAVIYKDS